MSAALRVGVALPQTFGSARVDARLVTTAAVEIEALGFDGIWVQEDVLTRSGTLDALISLAYAAALTTRVDLGTAVLIAPLYDPVHLAKQIATLDQLSGGRLIVGVGLGGDSSQYPRLWRSVGTPRSTVRSRCLHHASALGRAAR